MASRAASGAWPAIASRIVRCSASAAPQDLRVLEIVRELCEIGIEPLIEEFADDADKDGVVEAAGDRDMERAVVDHRGFAGMLHRRHRLERGIDALDVSGVAILAACSAIALSMNSRARNSSNGPSIMADASGDVAECGRVADIDAGADADADPALDFERDQRFAHGRPRDFQLFGKIAFGRKPAADGIFAAVDQRTKLIGNLAI